MIEQLFERLLTSWLFWVMMVAIALWLAIVEAFFPRHVLELGRQLPAAPHAGGLESKNRSWFAGQIPGAPAGEQEMKPRHDSRRPPTTRASTFGHQVTANPTLVMVAVQQLRPLPCILANSPCNRPSCREGTRLAEDRNQIGQAAPALGQKCKPQPQAWGAGDRGVGWA